MEVTAMLSFGEDTGLTTYETKEKIALDQGRGTWSHIREHAISGVYSMRCQERKEAVTLPTQGIS